MFQDEPFAPATETFEGMRLHADLIIIYMALLCVSDVTISQQSQFNARCDTIALALLFIKPPV